MGETSTRKLRNMSTVERVDWLAEYADLTDEEKALFGNYGVTGEANALKENSIGTYHGLTLGIVPNLFVNGENSVMLMAIEEPSVIASQGYMNKMITQADGYRAEVSEPWQMYTQIQITDVSDMREAIISVEENRDEILRIANELDPILVGLGGGAKGLRTYSFDAYDMLITMLHVDTKDAMGANACNTMAEGIAPKLEELTDGKVNLRIISNLALGRMVTSEVEIPFDILKTKKYSGEEIAVGMESASLFANLDPFRAATSNKGIMNGVSAVAIAYGQDFRALESGAHSYAFYKGKDGEGYSLTNWSHDAEFLYGKIEMPCAVGIVGGACKTIPQAKVAMKISKIGSAEQLAERTVSVGLGQNMAAVRALSTEGIQKGHMRLHGQYTNTQ